MAALPTHGAEALPALRVDTYNAELRDRDGFVGDRASTRAFQAILDDWRERLGDDPLGEQPTEAIGKERLDATLAEGDPDAAALVHSAVEEFAQELAGVVRRFLRLPAWRGTERIVVGGGLRASRVGELAIARASVLLRTDAGHALPLTPIRHHPDAAGLIGAAHLAPAAIFAGHDSILAADIGGTNMRAGVVALNLDRAPDLSAAEVAVRDHWHHRSEEPDRDEAVERLADMLCGLAQRAAEQGRRLAPFVGIGCPGLIEPDGRILRGGQNLPGDWEAPGFRLPDRLRDRLPRIAGQDSAILLHNDAVVQGLSEAPFQRDVQHWGVLTIGTGLGNARFTNQGASAAT